MALFIPRTCSTCSRNACICSRARGSNGSRRCLQPFSKTTAQFSENATSYQGGALYDITKNLGIYASWSQSFNPQNVLLRSEFRFPSIRRRGCPCRDRSMPRGPPCRFAGKGTISGSRKASCKGIWILPAPTMMSAAPTKSRRGKSLAPMGPRWIFTTCKAAPNGPRGGIRLDRKPGQGRRPDGQLQSAVQRDPLSDTTIPAYVGKEIQNNPKEQFTFFSKYTWQDGWLNGAFLGLGGRYWGHSSAFAATQPQLATLPPYFIMQAVTGYRWKIGRARYSVQLNVDNLLDRRHALQRVLLLRLRHLPPDSGSQVLDP